jgi:hypothetical protein
MSHLIRIASARSLCSCCCDWFAIAPIWKGRHAEGRRAAQGARPHAAASVMRAGSMRAGVRALHGLRLQREPMRRPVISCDNPKRRFRPMCGARRRAGGRCLRTVEWHRHRCRLDRGAPGSGKADRCRSAADQRCNAPTLGTMASGQCDSADGAVTVTAGAPIGASTARKSRKRIGLSSVHLTVC